MAGGLKRFLQQSSILILIGSFLSQSALASYDRTVNWADMTDLDLRGILRSEYASKGNLLSPVIADSSYALVMRDADGRVNKDFHIPELLRPNVAFWLDIYTKYTTQHHLLVDSNHPELVYEVLDFRELAEKSRTRSSYEWAAHRLVAKKMAAYRSAFARLMSNSHPRHPSVEEKNILEVYHRSRHRQSLSELAKNIKTQSGQRDNIVKGLLAAETFFPKMEMLFNKMGIPQELTRLSLVESSFDMGARSKVGALGVWQFMPDTGKDYLLMDTRHRIDERLSPLKSTIAAGKLLQWNHRFLGSWVLAVIAYNHGARGLPRVSATRPVSFNRYSKLFDACAKRGALGWASRNYYSEFLAVLYAEAYHHLFYGEVPASTIRPLSFERVASSRMDSLHFAMERGISVQEFRLLNPDVKDLHRLLPKGFWLAVPSVSDDLGGLITAMTPADSTRRQPSSESPNESVGRCADDDVDDVWGRNENLGPDDRAGFVKSLD